MPQLLLEFFSEEIPARMQKRAEEDLAKLLSEALAANGFAKLETRTLSGPRRIAIVVENLPARAADVNEERKGPRVGSPEKALEGFLKAAGLKSIDEAEIVKDPKGDFYLAKIARKGRDTTEILAEIVPSVAKSFPWPKSMRSGTSDFIWVRPLHRVVCVFDGKPVAFDVGGVTSGNETEGHRFHAPGVIAVKNADEYAAKLEKAYVLVDREARKARILDAAKRACADRKLELVEDAGLLEEVAGLSEWPVVVLGDMNPDFLDLPAEVIRLTMRTHQRYFAVCDPVDGKLAPHFVTVANVEAKDGGKAIAEGNARVLSARLNDARFFWDVDRKAKLETRAEKLKSIVFHQKLGSVWDKVERVRALAKELAPVVGADVALVDRAALLAKCDLVTETVGEFPELQGQIGRQFAELEGEKTSVCVAIEDHYRPLGPNDRVPSDLVAVTVALADKLDTLIGFWVIEERPTGSKDPYALRRSALGYIRTTLEHNVRLSILAQAYNAESRYRPYVASNPEAKKLAEQLTDQELVETRLPFINGGRPFLMEHSLLGRVDRDEDNQRYVSYWLAISELLAFLADRLKVHLRDQGKRHDLIDAVFALGDDDLVRIVARVEALEAFLKTDDGKNLLAGYKRAANILAAEEKKGKGLSEDELKRGVDPSLLTEPAERALHSALVKAGPAAEQAVAAERFGEAMTALAQLRAPVDQFFTDVLVNAEKAEIRTNRLLLLAQIRAALSGVADFSKIEG